MNVLSSWKARLPAARRLSWGVGDQAVSSLATFLLGVVVARSMGAASLGALGLALVAQAIVVNCSRALSTDPLMIRFSTAAPDSWRKAVASSGGVALVIGTAGGVACLAIAGVLHAYLPGSQAGAAFLALGIGLPGLALQDSFRYAFFAAGQGVKTFVNDVVRTVLLFAALLGGAFAGFDGIMWVVLAFGGSAALAALLGMAQARTTVSVGNLPGWLRQHRDLGPRFLVENVVLGTAGQIRSIVVAAAVGLVAVGAIRGAEMLVGPVAALLMGIAQVAVPEAARVLGRGGGRLLQLCLAISVGLASVTLLWGLVILAVFPFGVGELLLGSVWAHAHVLVLGVIVSAAAGCMHVGPSAGLRALGRADRTMRCQIATTTLAIGCCTLGALAWDAQGAVWGSAVASIIGAVLWWRELTIAMREHDAGTHADGDLIIASLMRPAGGSGVQSHVRTVAEYLQSTARPAHVVSPFSSRSPLLLPVLGARLAIERVSSTASVWWYRRWHGYFLERALADQLSRQRCRVIYAQCPVSAAAALRVRTDQAVVMAAHFNVSQADEWVVKGAIAPDGALFRSILAFEERVLGELDGIVYVSEFTRHLLHDRIPRLRDVADAVVPNPVPVAVPAASEDATADLVTVGSLEPRKNQGYLLQVLHAAARRGHRFTLTVVGDGQDRRKLERLSRDLGLTDQVSFVGYQADTRQFLRSHRLYCHASKMESFGIVLVEAMAEGLPVLAGAVGGVPEVIRPGEDGAFWPLDDPDAAADVLVELMTDPARGSRMAAAARDRAATEFATDVVCARLLAFLDSFAETTTPVRGIR